MYQNRFQLLNAPIHASEELITSSLQKVAKRAPLQHNWRITAAMAAGFFLVVGLIFFIQAAPKDLVASSGEQAKETEPLIPLASAHTHNCDVRDMELRILSSSVRNGVLFLEVALTGSAIHDNMVVTWRLYDGCATNAYSLYWDDVAIAKHGKGLISHLLSFSVNWNGESGSSSLNQSPFSIVPGQPLTLAVNNYDCGLDHTLYPHWAPDAPWEAVLPDCLIVTFTLAEDGSLILLPDAPTE